MNTRSIVMALLAMICISNTIYAQSLLVEGEAFKNCGGWKIDSQFMDQMGSPYLLAHGMGEPVEDATTEVTLPALGRYHVYVRTFNWTAPWFDGRGPGSFCLLVNGKRVGAELGTTGTGWMWQYAGSVKVKQKDATLTLRDNTGFDGRCDAIYFTTDAADVPVGIAPELRSAPTEEIAGSYDLVVVGGGIAGMSAAVAAARLGNCVALVTDRPVLGGNNSSEVRVHLGGRIELDPYPALGGLQKEFGPVRKGNAQPAEFYEDNKKLAWIQAEPNVDLFLSYHVNAVDTLGGKIRAVSAAHTSTGKRLRFEAPLFADCTGDGTVGYLAGAHWVYGREASDQYNEPTAPAEADSLVMGSSIQWRTREARGQADAKFPKFRYGFELNDSTCHRVDMGEWTWETGMNRHQIDDAERVRDYGMLVVYTNWSYLRNELGLFPGRRLDWVGFVAGKRESRRLLGDYILKEEDMTRYVVHEDASFITSWSIDLHFPDPENTRYFPGEEFIASTRHLAIYPYPVPYRCLYSRNVDNLFMAGRNISATHVAMGTTRVMRTGGMMGEVVGIAADICRRHQATPRDVYRTHLAELNELMSRGVAKEGLENNQQYNGGRRLLRKPEVK